MWRLLVIEAAPQDGPVLVGAFFAMSKARLLRPLVAKHVGRCGGGVVASTSVTSRFDGLRSFVRSVHLAPPGPEAFSL